MTVTKYRLLKDVAVLDALFIKYDIIYIQDYDMVDGGPQSVFNGEKKLISKISSRFYWGMAGMMEKIKE